MNKKHIDLKFLKHVLLNHLSTLQTVFKSAPHPVFIAGLKGDILFKNDFLTDADSIIFNNQQYNFQNFVENIIISLSDNSQAAKEIGFNNRYFSFSVTQIDNTYLFIGTDITDVIKEKDFYKEALDNLPADIGVFNLQGKYIYVNPAGIKDAALRQWIIGKTDFDYCRYRGKDTSMAERRKALIEKIIETKTEQGYEEEIIRSGQETDWQLRKLSPVFDNNGEIKFFLAYGINIKDRKQAELAQKEALAIIESSAKAKEEFVAVMSHEIRTPMNAIIGMSRLLAKTSLDKKQSEYLDAILTASGNLIVIVNDILDFSKIEAGKLRLEHADFSFHEVFEYAKAVTSQQAAEKLLELEFTIDKDVSDFFVGDIYRINQVVVNLLNNAIKFTHKGKVSTHIKLEKDNKEEQEICICVNDTGIGMTEIFMQEMFTMYSQEVGVTRKYGGTGLGLKITSQLVELMNGRIEVTSKKNEGSCIKVKLTLPKGAAKDITAINNLKFDDTILSGKKILIAEDNSLNVLLASAVLENYGATVVTAENGQEAIDVLSKPHNINAVLMDVEMPVMDGLEATSFIRKNISTSIPIIALTANVMPDDQEKLIAAGMTEFISKPFAESELINTILRSLQ